jgi:hypothetical protein
MKYMIGLLVVGLVGVSALIAAGYCLWLTTTSLSYRRVDIVENEFLLSPRRLCDRAGQFGGDCFALASITPRIAKKTGLTPRGL